MEKIKFYKGNSLPTNLQPQHNGIWFIKDGDDKFTIYVVSEGEAKNLTAPLASVGWGDITGDILDQTNLIEYITEYVTEERVSLVNPYPELGLDPTNNPQQEDFNKLIIDYAKANAGEPGPPGDSPTIGINGNWFIGTRDTGVPASPVYETKYDQEINGQRNNNSNFTVTQAFVPGTLEVFIDGIMLTKGNGNDFIELNPGVSGNGATISRLVNNKQKLIFRYQKIYGFN